MEARKEELKRLMLAKQAELEALRQAVASKEQARKNAAAAALAASSAAKAHAPAHSVAAAHASSAVAASTPATRDMPALDGAQAKRRLGDCPPLGAPEAVPYPRAMSRPVAPTAAAYAQLLSKAARVEQAGSAPRMGMPGGADGPFTEKRRRLDDRLGAVPGTAAPHEAKPPATAVSGSGTFEVRTFEQMKADRARQQAIATPPTAAVAAAAQAKPAAAEPKATPPASTTAFRVRSLDEILAEKKAQAAAATTAGAGGTKAAAGVAAAGAASAPAPSRAAPAARAEPKRPMVAPPADDVDDDDLLAGVEAGDADDGGAGGKFSAEAFDQELRDMETLLAA
ncbi:hypothetical protein KFE25_009011 [Diacronema lutheri]|uniref:Uncharacterized protein n=1 Tax=Diacronema lutheri TaxID=2081491 RepID=A0A8J5Y346_DIALT|nr:hypothetical protein KFE25_009011 [Diacronema lutheri]